MLSLDKTISLEVDCKSEQSGTINFIPNMKSFKLSIFIWGGKSPRKKEKKDFGIKWLQEKKGREMEKRRDFFFLKGNYIFFFTISILFFFFVC